VQQWLGDFAKGNKLDFVQVQEINGYHKALEQIPGYHLVTFPKSKVTFTVSRPKGKR
jgi:hypothetical protein